MRLAGWERRLAELVAAARDEPYVLGSHDCFRLACRVVEALTGVDRWPEFAGYSTRREALAKLAAHGSTFEAAAAWFFGGPARPIAEARRGDIVMIVDVSGQKHLGVCLGQRSVGLLSGGIISGPTLALPCCWRVG